MTTAALSQDRRKTWAMVGAAVAVWATLGVIVLYQQHQRTAPQREWASTEAQIFSAAEQTVRARLKDPDSAIFSDERVLGSGPDQRVCGKVNAKNGYGGYAGSERYLVMMGSAYLGDDRPSEALWSRSEHPCDVF